MFRILWQIVQVMPVMRSWKKSVIQPILTGYRNINPLRIQPGLKWVYISDRQSKSVV